MQTPYVHAQPPSGYDNQKPLFAASRTDLNLRPEVSAIPPGSNQWKQNCLGQMSAAGRSAGFQCVLKDSASKLSALIGDVELVHRCAVKRWLKRMCHAANPKSALAHDHKPCAIVLMLRVIQVERLDSRFHGNDFIRVSRNRAWQSSRPVFQPGGFASRCRLPAVTIRLSGVCRCIETPSNGHAPRHHG